MKQVVYVVTMYRWGNRESHSYVLGVFTTKTKAEKAGQAEKEYRGGNKYYPECIEIPVDTLYDPDWKTVVELEHNPDMLERGRNERSQKKAPDGGVGRRVG